MDTLRGGQWVGKGATAFYREMDSAILPAMKKLASALDSAGAITKQISQIIKQAEEDSAALFRVALMGGAAGAGGAGADGGSGGAGGTGGAGSAGGAGGTGGQPGGGGSGGAGSVPDWQRNNPNLARDPNSLFQDGYMRGLIDSQFQGADSRALRNAMTELAKNPTGADLDRVLGQIAQARGRPVSEIRADYDKYLRLRQERNAARPDDIPPELNTILHPWFMGSTTQMRYGKVVGDAFGVDPVFGAMLNPTGGLVMPGNTAFDGDSTAVGYHGIVHDAAGYLYNYHHSGPGYDYLGRENRDPSSPLSGQREGIRYWRETLGGVQPGSTAAEYVMRGVVGVADAGNWVADKFNRLRNIF